MKISQIRKQFNKVVKEWFWRPRLVRFYELLNDFEQVAYPLQLSFLKYKKKDDIVGPNFQNFWEG